MDSSKPYQRLLAGIPQTAGMKSGHVTLKPGESIGEHKTESRQEAIIILEGKAEIYCEGKYLFQAEKNSLVYIPPETNHDIRNNTNEYLSYVYVVSAV